MKAGVIGSKRAAFFGTLLVGLSFGAKSFGWGLVVPGPDTAPNYYYSVEGEKLYRYICPQGEVATAENCIHKDPAFLITYPAVRKALEADVKNELFEVMADIKKEVAALKEADPRVQVKRKAIKDSLDQIAGIKEKSATLEKTATTLRTNLKAVEKQLEEITQRLAGELPQEEISRLVEIRTARLAEQAKFSAKLATIDAEASLVSGQINKLNETIANTSSDLGKLLPTIVVSSTKLIGFQEEKDLLNAELELLPELDKRLCDSIAYPLDIWIASGTAGVTEFVARFEKRACSMARGEVSSGNPRRAHAR